MQHNPDDFKAGKFKVTFLQKTHDGIEQEDEYVVDVNEETRAPLHHGYTMKSKTVAVELAGHSFFRDYSLGIGDSITVLSVEEVPATENQN